MNCYTISFITPRYQFAVLSVIIVMTLAMAFLATDYYYRCSINNCEPITFPIASKLFEGRGKQDGKLLGMMYMLVRHLDFSKGSMLYETLNKLKTNFLPYNNYPILILYDNYSKSISHQKLQTKMQSAIKDFLNGTKVKFQETKFEIPSPEINIARFEVIDPFYLGYRYMCRFHAIQAMQLPEFDKVKFVLRLDDDSSIISSYKKDIFKYCWIRSSLYSVINKTLLVYSLILTYKTYFDKEDLEYGYVFTFGDARRYMKNLYNFTKSYIKRKNLSATFFDHWDDEDVFYNNFELSKVSFWRRKDVQDYLTAIDKHGGIFYHRWGDAPIKTMALSIFMPWSKMHCFKDIHYKHKIYENHAQSNICSYIVPTWNRHWHTWLKKNKSNPIKRIFGTYT